MSAAASDLETFRDGVSRLQRLLSSLDRGPNFFRVVPRLFRVEGVHSDLLAWLLDPQGFHGLGDSFAIRFITGVLRESGAGAEGPITINSVETEASTGEGPIDILVHTECAGRPLIVGIENKIDAPLGDEQLLRYARGLVARFPHASVVLVLLAPTARDVDAPPVCCGFAGLTYRNVVAWLDASLVAEREAQNAGAGRELAVHYLEELRTRIVPESRPEIDQLLRDLAGHTEAWRLIRRRLPSERDDTHAALARAVCARLSTPEVCGPPWQFALRRDGYARVFRPDWSALGYRDAETMIGLTEDEFAATRYARVHFRLSSAPPEDDAEARWRFEARLRLDARGNDTLGASIRGDLAALGLLEPVGRDRRQLTLRLKQSSRLPGLADDSVPDAVVEWFVRQIRPVVAILDGRLRQA
jgi:hypothetical protein